MATNQIFPAEPLERRGIPSGKTLVLTALAFLLALTLGLSAVDQHALDAGPGMSLEQAQPVLDGRGKWGGYLK